MKSLTYDKCFKIILVGDSYAGKTLLLSALTNNPINNSTYLGTIGVDFGSVIVNYEDKKIKLQIWDTAGQERFQSIIQSYYKTTNAIILVYDITNMNSFIHIPKWMDDAIKYSPNDAPILIVGNKIDLKIYRKVSYEEGLDLATKNNVSFIEISSKENTNINELTNILCEKLLKITTEMTKLEDIIKINNGNDTNFKNLKKKCC